MNLLSALRKPKHDRRCARAPESWSGVCLVLIAILLWTLAGAPGAIADDINPDADIPDSSTLDSSPPNPVLEIPQQCDQDSVAILCDRSSADTSSSSDATADAAPSIDANDSSNLASSPDLGSVYDYANQNITNDAFAAGTMNVPMGYYVPAYPVLSPAPRFVPSGPGSYQQWAAGPGSFQQWARGPGTYQQMAPGPGYIQPAPMGFHPYGMGGSLGSVPLGGVGGSRPGR